jgi:N-carbamoyl-L-amino-acid hydrolase
MLNQVRTTAGFKGSLADVRLSPGYYSAFVELHIEQGPILEREGIPVGVVTSIAAPASLRVEIEGEGGHAGAVLMPHRRDAFLVAAELALAVEAAAKSTGSLDTVATTGVCNVFPGAVNSIPSRVQLELDIRDIDQARRDSVIEQIEAKAQIIALRRDVGIGTTLVNADAPAQCAPLIVDTLSQACRDAGLPYLEMVSRAYHDSLFLSRITPTAMLFIPCWNGVSHRPDEYASPEAIAQGAEVLARTLLALAAAP